jgi:hypothetical protein
MDRGVIKKGWRGLWSVDQVDGGGVCCLLWRFSSNSSSTFNIYRFESTTSFFVSSD